MASHPVWATRNCLHQRFQSHNSRLFSHFSTTHQNNRASGGWSPPQLRWSAFSNVWSWTLSLKMSEMKLLSIWFYFGDGSTMKTEDDCVRPHICEFDGTTFAETSQSGRGMPDRPRVKTDDKTQDTTKCRPMLVALRCQMELTLFSWPQRPRITQQTAIFQAF